MSTNQTTQPTRGCFWGMNRISPYIQGSYISYKNICWQGIFVVFTLILAISRKAVSVGFGKPSLKQVTLEWRVAWKLTITTLSGQHIPKISPELLDESQTVVKYEVMISNECDNWLVFSSRSPFLKSPHRFVPKWRGSNLQSSRCCDCEEHSEHSATSEGSELRHDAS